MSTENGGGDPAPRDSAVPEIVDGRYKVIRVLSEDRFGRTLLVRDQKAENEALALKIFWPNYSAIPDFEGLLDRCVQVARAIVGQHINRVRSAAHDADGRDYLTFDPVDGETLGQCLTREDVLQPRHALQVARQLLMALATGHEKGQVHDEVTTSNVLLANAAPKTRTNPHGVDVRLMGFGFAELANREGFTRTETYLSPESAEGKQVDARSDLFSVGMICCEMLLGRKAFLATDGNGIRPLVLRGDVEKLKQLFVDLPPGVADLVVKALSVDRDKRYASALEFRKAIEKCPAYQETTSTPLSVEIAIVVLVLFGACAGWFGWSQYSESTSRGSDLARQSKDLTASLDEIKKLKAERSAISPQAYLARGFDASLELIGAQKRLDAFALLGALSPNESPIPGIRFLTDLARTTSAISDVAEFKDARTRQQLVARARKMFQELEELRATFASDAGSWLEYRAPGTRDDPRRLEHLDRVLRALSGRLHALESEIAVVPVVAAAPETAAPTPASKPTPPAPSPEEEREEREEAWKRILADGPDQDPEAAFDLAARSASSTYPRLEKLTEEYRDAVKIRLVNGSHLNRKALAAERYLLEWTDRLEKLQASHGWQAARDIRLLGYARQLYHEGKLGPFPLDAVFDPSARKERDWRDRFYLRAKIVERPCLVQQSDFLTVFVQQVGHDQPTFVQVENTGTSSDNPCAFFVTVFDEEGNQFARREVRVLAEGSRRSWDGERIDLVHDAAEIAVYQPPPQKLAVPRQAGVRAEDLARHEAQYAALDEDAKECLVFGEGSVSIWISPRLGLVRIVDGKALKQLIYSGPRP